MILKILLIGIIIIAILMYLIILGANRNITDEERRYEDEEQAKALRKMKTSIKERN